jgi:two-component system sensor histidine kinase LytS
LALAEIKALQAQINPHFLFNALNTIVHYCRKQPETARKLLLHLSNYYRNSISVSDSFVSLNTELQHINDYVKIESARFMGKLDVVYDIPDECNCQVPTLILQPIVENAIKHGLYPKKNGGKVVISGRLDGKNVVLVVEDDGIGMEESQVRAALNPDPNRQSIGICNVNSRLKSLYGEQYELVIDSKVGKGTQVSISIPLGGNVKNDKGDNS